MLLYSGRIPYLLVPGRLAYAPLFSLLADSLLYNIRCPAGWSMLLYMVFGRLAYSSLFCLQASSFLIAYASLFGFRAVSLCLICLSPGPRAGIFLY